MELLRGQFYSKIKGMRTEIGIVMLISMFIFIIYNCTENKKYRNAEKFCYYCLIKMGFNEEIKTDEKDNKKIVEVDFIGYGDHSSFPSIFDYSITQGLLEYEGKIIFPVEKDGSMYSCFLLVDGIKITAAYHSTFKNVMFAYDLK